jgi:hypothetical protein
VELLLSGMAIEDVPRILKTYLFCCPGLDGRFRCLPKAGGYYDQDYADLLGFEIIERHIAQHRYFERQREEARTKK